MIAGAALFLGIWSELVIASRSVLSSSMIHANFHGDRSAGIPLSKILDSHTSALNRAGPPECDCSAKCPQNQRSPTIGDLRKAWENAQAWPSKGDGHGIRIPSGARSLADSREWGSAETRKEG
jgi:hypothetical protein